MGDLSNFAAGALVGAGGVLTVILVVAAFFVFCFLMPLIYVANAMIFVKAGKPAWVSVIPFYNNYVLFELATGKEWLALIYTFLSLGGLIPNPILAWSVVAILLVLEIFMCVKLAKKFGKGTGFAIGLIFLPIVFIPILGFDKSKFVESVAQEQ